MTHHSFDLHIEYSVERYDSEDFVTCEVTYPARGPQPVIQVDYTKTDSYGWDDGKSIERATQDIARYIEDPDAWMQDYIERSSADARKLAQAQHDLALFQRWAADAERDLQKYQQRIREAEQTIAALQARKEEQQA